MSRVKTCATCRRWVLTPMTQQCCGCWFSEPDCKCELMTDTSIADDTGETS